MKNLVYKMKIVSFEVQQIQQDIIASIDAIYET